MEPVAPARSVAAASRAPAAWSMAPALAVRFTVPVASTSFSRSDGADSVTSPAMAAPPAPVAPAVSAMVLSTVTPVPAMAASVPMALSPLSVMAPLAVAFSADTLIPLALETRLDLTAAQQAVALREDALGVTRRWRWFGTVEVGYEREREFDGGVSRGPSVSLGLPLFNQGQGALERAQAELLQARADLDAQVLAVHNAAHLGIERLTVAATIAERYRSELVPRREAIVARTQERVNFMLVGVFELLLAKQQEYDAFQAYLEAVRDYWTARAELRGAVGGRLPDDDQPLPPTVGVEAILPAASASPMDHGAHGMPSESEADPHAGHRMPEAPSAHDVDPHEGHDMPKPKSAQESDPHAGHGSNAAEPVDPHAGHRKTGPERDPPAKDDTDDSADAHSDHDHDHGDRP